MNLKMRHSYLSQTPTTQRNGIGTMICDSQRDTFYAFSHYPVEISPSQVLLRMQSGLDMGQSLEAGAA